MKRFLCLLGLAAVLGGCGEPTLLERAEMGDAEAQYNLGDTYANGIGVTKDDEEAVKWYRKAAEQGHAEAQFSLGLMYAFGEGVAKDLEEAVKWYRKAAEQGLAEAKKFLKETPDK